MVSRVIPVDNFDLVVFGGTGDLAQRKIIPGLYRRFWAGQIPADSNIIGAARSELDDKGFQDLARAAIAEFVAKDKCEPEVIDAFIARLSYVAIDAKGKDGWAALKKITTHHRTRQPICSTFSPARVEPGTRSYRKVIARSP